jgi:hypothetical protein
MDETDRAWGRIRGPRRSGRSGPGCSRAYCPHHATIFEMNVESYRRRALGTCFRAGFAEAAGNCRANKFMEPSTAEGRTSRIRSTHRFGHSRTASCLIIAGWEIVGWLSAGIMRHRMAATASVLNWSGMSSRATRRRGEGRSPEPSCLTALTDGFTNDGGMAASSLGIDPGH